MTVAQRLAIGVGAPAAVWHKYRQLERLAHAAGLGHQMEAHYRALELTPPVTRGQIRAAYKRLAKQHHPDKAGSSDAFAAIAAAHAALMNDKVRLRFEQGLDISPLFAKRRVVPMRQPRRNSTRSPPHCCLA